MNNCRCCCCDDAYTWYLSRTGPFPPENDPVYRAKRKKMFEQWYREDIAILEDKTTQGDKGGRSIMSNDHLLGVDWDFPTRQERYGEREVQCPICRRIEILTRYEREAYCKGRRSNDTKTFQSHKTTRMIEVKS